MTSSPRTARERLRAPTWIAVSFLTLGLLDIAWSFVSGIRLTGSASLLLLGVSSFWALLAGVSAFVAGELWSFSARWHHGVRVAVLTAVLAFVPLVLLASLATTGLPSLVGAARWAFVAAAFAAILAACAFVVWMILRRAPLRPEPSLPPAAGAGLAGVALAAYVADATLFVRLYPELHHALAYVSLLALLASSSYTRKLSRPFEAPRVSGALAAALLVLTTAAWLRSFPASDYAVLFESSTWASKLASFSQSIIDLDADGHSPVIGGGDCDDRAPSINPGALDIPENGVDEDCTDGDLTLEKIAAVGGATKTLGPAETARPSHIFLITVDTLRADHVSAYGYGRNTTPHLDALARDAMLFERAFSQSNNTASSFPALFTGRYPSGSPWSFEPADQHARGWPFLHDENNLTLSELLVSAGFRTVAIMRGSVALATGLEQGIQRKIIDPQDPAEAFSRVLIESGAGPLFVWLHLDYPHAPYSPKALPFGSSPIDAYDAEILETDGVIGRALDAIRARGLWDTSLVAITADHGEEFGEHGGQFHASTLYDEQIHVPLIVSFPRRQARRVARNVQLVDLMPTIAASVGQTLSVVDGQSLLEDVSIDESVAYSEHYDGIVRRRAVIRGRHKLIQRVVGNVLELYDLSADPGEKKNLIDSEPQLAQQLRSAMDAIASRRDLLLVAQASRGDRQGMQRLAENLHLVAQPRLKAHASEMVSREVERGMMPMATLFKMAGEPELPPALREVTFDAIVRLGKDARDELARLMRVRNPQIASRAKAAWIELPGNERFRPEGGRLLALDFDGSPIEASLHGFGGAEKLGRRTVRWGSAASSRILFEYSGSPRKLSLSLEGRAIAAASSDLEVSVTMNGDPIGALRIPKSWSIRGVLIPSQSVRTGENVLELRYSETVEPAKIDAASRDSRQLSVLYDWLVVALVADRAEVELGSPLPSLAEMTGFHDVEGAGDAAFRWSRGSRSEVALFLTPEGNHDYELIFDARAFHPIAPVGVRVSINGSPVGTVSISEENRAEKLLIPGAHISPLSRIQFDYERFAKPADVVQASRDTRELALRWSGFRLVPVADKAQPTTRESSVNLPPTP